MQKLLYLHIVNVVSVPERKKKTIGKPHHKLQINSEQQ